MCCCDYERATLYECRMVVGRKPHTCVECLRVIERGERHEYVKGLWSGEFATHRTCEQCIEVRKAIAVECYAFSMMMDHIDPVEHGHLVCVVEFEDRRRANYERRRAARQAAC